MAKHAKKGGKKGGKKKQSPKNQKPKELTNVAVLPTINNIVDNKDDVKLLITGGIDMKITNFLADDLNQANSKPESKRESKPRIFKKINDISFLESTFPVYPRSTQSTEPTQSVESVEQQSTEPTQSVESVEQSQESYSDKMFHKFIIATNNNTHYKHYIPNQIVIITGYIHKRCPHVVEELIFLLGDKWVKHGFDYNQMINILEYLSLKYRFIIPFKQYRETEKILKKYGKWDTTREISPYYSCKPEEFEKIFYEKYGFTKGYFDWNENIDETSETSELSSDNEELENDVVNKLDDQPDQTNNIVHDNFDISDDELMNMIEYQYKKFIHRKTMPKLKPVIFLDTLPEVNESTNPTTNFSTDSSTNSNNCGYKGKKKAMVNYDSDMSDYDDY